MLKTSSQRDIVEIVRQIRGGLSPEDIVTLAKKKDALSASHDSQIARNGLLVSLLHSTGSLQDLVRLALNSTAEAKLLGHQDFEELRNRVVHLPLIQEILRDASRHLIISRPARLLASPKVAASTSASLGTSTPRNNDTGHPPHHVPALPWTTITDDDNAVSHLTSLFFSWINPTWLFVEEDLFLRGSSTDLSRSSSHS